MTIHLAGIPVRDEAVLKLARPVDDPELATRLETASRGSEPKGLPSRVPPDTRVDLGHPRARPLALTTPGHRVWVGERRGAMIRYQLIFRERDGERTEVWNDNRGGEPTIHGKPIVDGETFVIRGKEWVVRCERGGSQDMARFSCTPIALSATRPRLAVVRGPRWKRARRGGTAKGL